MRRVTTSIVTAGVVMLLAISVRGDSPHYIRLSPSIDSQTFCYNVTLKEAGLGTADVHADRQRNVHRAVLHQIGESG